MALKNIEAEALMQDAREMQAEGTRMIDAGDWRNGSEQGWLAVCHATEALVRDVTGVENSTDKHSSLGLNKLAMERGGEYRELVILWGYFSHYLLYGAFYDGVYHDDLAETVREVADYIRRAEELAG